MKIIGIIPARMAATRFPNKPMALIQGIPMIGHCYIRSKMCNQLDEVFVATCDIEIKEYIESIGGDVIMTSNSYERASERTAEAVSKIEKQTKKIYSHIIMIQGDEPLVDPFMISEVIKPMSKEKIEVGNLMIKLDSLEDSKNPNFVKVVLNKNQ